MTALRMVRVLAVLFTGLAAGVFLGHRVGVSIARGTLAASGFVQLQQSIHARFAVLMPILVLGAVGGSLLWTFLLRARWRTVEFRLVAVASLAMVGVAVLTRAVNVPINDQLVTWSVEAPPANLEELWAPWEQAHSIRTVLAMAAFVLQAIALSGFAAAPVRAPVAEDAV